MCSKPCPNNKVHPFVIQCQCHTQRSQKCSRHLTMEHKWIMICRLHILASWNSCILQLQWHLCQTHPTHPWGSGCCPSSITSAAAAPPAKSLHHGQPQQWLCTKLLSQEDLTASRATELTSVSKETEKKCLSSKIITKVANYLDFPTGGICLHLSRSPVFMDLWQDNVLGDVPWSHLLFTFHMCYSCMTSFTQTTVSLHPRAV